MSEGRRGARDRAPRRISDALLRWYGGRERRVPWRGEADPYRIWVGEVMAQQTRLVTVHGYWEGFLERFPTVQGLAAASRDEVLKAWEGLGYYGRARNLHRAARLVVERCGGSLPSDPAALRALPGIGPYTAGAIASLAFGKPEPAVDGNVRRVLCRLHDLPSSSPKSLRELARQLLAARPRAAAALNQALMDLGSEVCVARVPECHRCPIASHCRALAAGTVGQRPAPVKRRPLPHHDVALGLVWNRGRLLIARRPEDGLLGGLWEFPGGKVESGEAPEEAVRRELREELGLEVTVGGFVARVDHAYSHQRVTLHAYHARPRDRRPRPSSAAPWRWVEPARLHEFAFPVANQRIISALREPTEASGAA